MDHKSLLPLSDDFEAITFEESIKLTHYFHAVHCCIYALSSRTIAEKIISPALISMQMRFDGCLGFPGGIVDDHDVLESLNRELLEENNVGTDLYATQQDYLFTLVNYAKKRCLHFYAKEVTEVQFENMEKNVFKARDFGKEVLGLLRVPMFVMNDGVRGLPMFLKNCFAGNAKDELLNFLVHFKFITKEELFNILEKQ